jgi:hypothetical protein
MKVLVLRTHGGSSSARARTAILGARAAVPETRDTEFSWEDFVERNNNELVATHSLRSVQAWGSLCQRPRRALGFMLSFAYKRFNGVVPEPGELDAEDRELLEKVEAGFQEVGDLLKACKFRAALGEALALAREANGYLDRKAPWFQIKEDPAGGSDQCLCHPARRGQSEDDPGTDPAAHACANAQDTEAARVPGLRRATLRDAAGGGVPGRNALPSGADV